jgi:hypothetical protein
MNIKTKKVYYCEFCKKHGLRRDSIEQHERYCTANPKRECRMCEDVDPDIDFEITGKKEPGWASDYVVKSIVVGDECPACILAFIRRNKIDVVKTKDGKEWNYKEAVEKWWAERNANENYY